MYDDPLELHICLILPETGSNLDDLIGSERLEVNHVQDKACVKGYDGSL
jgi:hypothetical protein